MSVVYYNGSPLSTNGRLPAVGEKAPDFIVTKPDLSEIYLKNYLGRKIILNIFPSLDTPTCAMAMHKFDEIAQKHFEVLILCISADLPFAQKRFCSAEHLANVQPVSVFRHSKFGEDYGVAITDGIFSGLLCRAVFIIDEHGKITYSQRVSELTNEPDYPAILNALSATS